MGNKLKNVIKLSNTIDMYTINIHIAQMEQLIYQQNYADIILDFNSVNSLKSSGMLRLCSFTGFHSKSNIIFIVKSNKNLKIKKELISYGWGSLIDPNYSESSYKGYLYTPVAKFNNPDEQLEMVNTIMNTFLSAFPKLTREAFGTIEWIINELMDNVMVHNSKETVGLVQTKVLRSAGKEIELVISDDGVGIPSTLKTAFPKKNDSERLIESIKEEVTNGKGQGNGLFGASHICRYTDGDMHINSGNISLKFIAHKGISTSLINSKFSGTIVYAKIKTRDVEKLEKGLVFSGKLYHPTDFIELCYENVMDSSNYKYTLSKEKDSTGSRVYGKTLRKRMLNLFKMENDFHTIEFDFSNINIISSSFADELLSKIIESKGLQFFSDNIIVSNCNDNIKQIINKVCVQRNRCNIRFL